MDGFTEIEQQLPGVVEQAESLEELQHWLEAQPYVQSVTLVDYWIKTYPPQREFVVELKGDSPSGELQSKRNSTVTRVMDVYVLENGRLRFSDWRQ